MKKISVIGFLILLYFHSFEVKSQSPFIRYDLNRIVLPKDSTYWKVLAEDIYKAKSSNQGKLTFLHIGDSHIQGDYFTGEVRKDFFQFLQVDARSRGITFPYHLARTNGSDEIISSSTGCLEYRSVRKAPKIFYTLTGYKILSCDTLNVIKIRDTSSFKFNQVYVFHSPTRLETLSINGNTANQDQILGDSVQVSVFMIEKPVSETQLLVRRKNLSEKFCIYGFYLLSNENQITYNNVGINGATFGTFLQLQGWKEMLAFLKPECIVFSYGTNDAINRGLDTSLIKSQIIQCIQRVKMILPNTPVIFTTPGDHLLNRKVINPRIAVIGNLIKKTAIDYDCAYWDFNEVMGGAGSIREWYKNQLVFRDWVHLSKKGYRLQGDLFFEALSDMFAELNKRRQ